MLSCASEQTHAASTSELATDHTASGGFVSIDPSGPPTTEAQLHVELVDRRRELLTRCEALLDDLEQRRRALGSVPAQLLTGVVAGAAASMAGNSAMAAAGTPVPAQLPTPRGVDVSQNVRLGVRIGDLRSGIHTLTVANTNTEIFDAIDQLTPRCRDR